MATQQEEVKIKLGVDGSGVSLGLQSLTGVFNKFSSNLTRSLGNLLKFNLAAMFGGDIIQIWDKGTQKLSAFIFQLDELAKKSAALEKTRQFWRNLRKEIEGEEAARLKGITSGADDAMDANLKLSEIESLRTGRTRLEQLKAEQKIMEERIELHDRFLGAQMSAKDALNLSLKLEQNKSEQLKIQTDELQKQKDFQAENVASAKRLLAELRGNVSGAQGAVASGLRGLSDVSLGEAISLVGISEGTLPGLRFSRQQIADIQRAQLLQRQAQQARIFGQEGLADSLSRQRIDLLKRNPFLSELDRNPLKVAEEQLAIAKQTLELAQGGGLAVKVKVTKR